MERTEVYFLTFQDSSNGEALLILAKMRPEGVTWFGWRSRLSIPKT